MIHAKVCDLARRAAPGLLIALSTMIPCLQAEATDLNASSAGPLKGQAIVQSKRAKPVFFSRGLLGEAVGLIGLAAAAESGNNLVAVYDIDDPADWVGRELIKDLVAQYDAVAGPDQEKLVESFSIGVVAATYSSAPFVLDSHTVTWQIQQSPFSPSRYKLTYRIRVKLIDTRTGKSLADGHCSHHDGPEGKLPTKSELLDNKAERLKQILHDSAAICLAELRVTTFGLADVSRTEAAQ